MKGALDPTLVLRRGTVLSALAFAGIVLLSGVENALSEVVEEILQLPPLGGSVLAGALVAGALLPMRKRLVRLTAPAQTSEPAADAQGPVR